MAATTVLTAGTVMDRMASLMNDTAKSNYTYVNMLPYLQMALDDLQEQFALNGIATTHILSASITIPANTTGINPSTGAAPVYPADLIQVNRMWEAVTGTNNFVPMIKVDTIDPYLVNMKTSSIGYWAMNGQTIQLAQSNGINQVKIEYVAALFTNVVNENSSIGIINSLSYLAFKGAEFCAKYIASNPERAGELKGDAVNALDRALGINTKGDQSISYRRRPFRR